MSKSLCELTVGGALITVQPCNVRLRLLGPVLNYPKNLCAQDIILLADASNIIRTQTIQLLQTLMSSFSSVFRDDPTSTEACKAKSYCEAVKSLNINKNYKPNLVQFQGWPMAHSPRVWVAWRSQVRVVLTTPSWTWSISTWLGSSFYGSLVPSGARRESRVPVVMPRGRDACPVAPSSNPFT